MERNVRSLIIGHAIGDALGVPVEFASRERLEADPVIGMRGYGTHKVPAGTWSDDTSMTLCLLESLTRLNKVDYQDIMNNFLLWMEDGEFTATWTAFDIGITTRHALLRLKPDPISSKMGAKGTDPLLCGEDSEYSNGNGSLMRIAPMALYLNGNLNNDNLQLVHNVSKLTHAHVRSQMACGIYVFIATELLSDKRLHAIETGIEKAYQFYHEQDDFRTEMNIFSRLWNVEQFAKLPEYDIKSSGYVVDTLEAAIWCLLNTDNYCECVLKAVNLGGDTDTVGAVTGGLAGLLYGEKDIPPSWKNELRRIDYIEKLCDDFSRNHWESDTLYDTKNLQD